MRPTSPWLPATVLLAGALGPGPTALESPPSDPPFSLSTECRMCHSNAVGASAMRDAKSRAIAPYDLWRSTMMANASRDPLWRAAVSAEVAATPGRRAEIEAKCTRCHAPMATRGGGQAPTSLALLDSEADGREGRRAAMGRDGVSCTVCHTIADADLGKPESYSGRFTTNRLRAAYGPHAEPFSHPMQMHTGLEPRQGKHVLKSALCATCHTLFTHTLDAKGEPTGSTYAEQTPYLEWRNSVFSDEVESPGEEAASCQDCHVPTTDVDGKSIRTRIARNPGGRNFPPTRRRAPFGRHVFVGGNTLVPAILRDHASELGVSAPKAAFDATIAAAKDQLQTRTAGVTLHDVKRAAGTVSFSVRVRNLAGHKFPSAYPSRRAWLRVRVSDGARTVFESGAWDAQGRIVVGGVPLPSEKAGGPIQPHRTEIDAADQVQIYEVVMADDAGSPTFRLMRAAKNHKDNRLLPRGWQATHAEAKHTAPIGTAGDADFVGGGDAVRYVVAVPGGKLRVEVELLYQTLSARYAAELFRWRTPEVERFEGYWRSADRGPVVVASVGLDVE